MSNSLKHTLPPATLENGNPWEKWLPNTRGKPCMPKDVVEYWRDQWKISIKMAIEMPLRDFDEKWALHTAQEKFDGQHTLNIWRETIIALMGTDSTDEGTKAAILKATAFMDKCEYDGQPLDNTLFYEALEGRCGKAWAAWALAAVSVIASRVVSETSPYVRESSHPACDVWVHGGFETICKTADQYMAEKANRLSQNMPSQWWFVMARRRSRYAQENVSFRGLVFTDAGDGEVSAIRNMARFREFLSYPTQRNLRDANGRSCDDLLPEIFKKNSTVGSVDYNDMLWAPKIAYALARFNPDAKENGKKQHEVEEPSGLASLAWLMTKQWVVRNIPGVDMNERAAAFALISTDVVSKILKIAYPHINGNRTWRNVWFDGCKNERQKEDRLVDLCMGAIWSMGRPKAERWVDFVMVFGTPDDQEDEKQENEIRVWWNVLWRLSGEVASEAWENLSQQDMEKQRNALRDKVFLMVFARTWANEKGSATNDNEAIEESPSVKRWKAFFQERAREGWKQNSQMWEGWEDMYPGLFFTDFTAWEVDACQKAQKATFSQIAREFRAFFEKDALQYAHREVFEIADKSRLPAKSKTKRRQRNL